MRPPTMIGTVAVAGQRAPEIRRCKQGDITLHAHFSEPGVEGGDCLIQRLHQVAVSVEQIIMIVKTAQAHKKHLPVGAQRSARVNHPRNNIQLRCKPVAARNRRHELRSRWQGRRQQGVRVNGSRRDVA